MAKRIPSMSKEWQEYLSCLLFHMLLPLLPIMIELWITGTVGPAPLFLSVAMYSIAIGMTSSSRLIFGLCCAITIIFAIVYGIAISKAAPPPSASFAAKWALLAVFVIHGAERYNLHVVDSRPFWAFGEA